MATTGTAGAKSFSLLEVVIATGIFAAAVTVLLAFLPALTRRGAGASDTLAALRLPDAIRGELQRIVSAGGLDNLAVQTAPIATPLPATLTMVAARDSTLVQSLDYLPPLGDEHLALDRQFYLVEVWRFNAAPLAYDAGGAVLALHVRVSWPHFTPGSAVATPLAARDQVTFNVGLNR
jgi:hypothetical protein